MIKILHGDSLKLLPLMAENSLDSCVTDPPYEIGFMGKHWDNSGVAFNVKTWAEVYRVLKPGAYLLAFGGTRTFHRMMVAIEDAGFILKDTLMWVHGNGFPKSQNISKMMDKAIGAKRKIIGVSTTGSGKNNTKVANHAKGSTGLGAWDGSGKVFNITAPSSAQAIKWNGFGTALKPGYEPIALFQKPKEKKLTIAQNVLKWGVGALNIDACRVTTHETIINHGRSAVAVISKGKYGSSSATVTHQTAGQKLGRWPANIIHDGSPEVMSIFAMFGNSKDGVVNKGTAIYKPNLKNKVFGDSMGGGNGGGYGGGGTAARFFYCAKANKHDRNGSKHPTVKPISLIAYLCRLVTPPGGTILDLFAGSGTTGAAANRGGFDAILCEQSEEYIKDICRRFDKPTDTLLSKKTLAWIDKIHAQPFKRNMPRLGKYHEPRLKPRSVTSRHGADKPRPKDAKPSRRNSLHMRVGKASKG